MIPITLLSSHKLPLSFYQLENTCVIAQELIGKILVSCLEGNITAARIVETEAYCGITDRASHAFNGRRTRRTEIMYAAGGVSYIYLCYGIHQLFNVVTNQKGIPDAVLIRSAEPVEGLKKMKQRTGKLETDLSLTRGPGNLTRAMGLFTHHTGTSLLSDDLYISDDGYKVSKDQIIATPRIGIDYAGEDALLPYRFILAGSPYLSVKKIFKIVPGIK